MNVDKVKQRPRPNRMMAARVPLCGCAGSHCSSGSIAHLKEPEVVDLYWRGLGTLTWWVPRPSVPRPHPAPPVMVEFQCLFSSLVLSRGTPEAARVVTPFD